MDVFSTDGCMPRWHCGTMFSGEPAWGWVSVVADVLIFLSYISIPLLLLWFVCCKKMGSFRRIFVLFSLFILLCGCTHLVDAVIFWWPVYRLLAVIKVATAAASVVTAVVLAMKLPEFLRLESPELMVQRNAELAAIANSSTKAFYVVDAASEEHEEGCCSLVNDNMCEILGMAREDIVGKNMHTLIHYKLPSGEVYPQSECLMFRAMRSAQPFVCDRDVIWDAHGEPVPCEWASTPVFVDDVPVSTRIEITPTAEWDKHHAGLQRSARRLESRGRKI